MNDESLLKALDNEENTSIMKLNSKKVLEEKTNMLNELDLDDVTFKQFMNKLKNYRFVDELQDIKYGSYIRWIKITDDNIPKLSNGGFIMDTRKHCCTCTNVSVVTLSGFIRAILFNVSITTNACNASAKVSDACVLRNEDIIKPKSLPVADEFPKFRFNCSLFS